MAKETVIIGCKLPAGLVLEVGLQTLQDNGKGQMFAQVKRLDSYERIVLKGWNHHNTTGLQLPAGMNMSPYLNRGVPKDLWERWKAAHADSWLLKNQVLFEAANEADAQVKVLDSAKAPTPLAPIDVTKPFAADIETADFDPLKKQAKAR